MVGASGVSASREKGRTKADGTAALATSRGTSARTARRAPLRQTSSKHARTNAPPRAVECRRGPTGVVLLETRPGRRLSRRDGQFFAARRRDRAWPVRGRATDHFPARRRGRSALATVARAQAVERKRVRPPGASATMAAARASRHERHVRRGLSPTWRRARRGPPCTNSLHVGLQAAVSPLSTEPARPTDGPSAAHVAASRRGRAHVLLRV
jgi:hypothetical protein